MSYFIFLWTFCSTLSYAITVIVILVAANLELIQIAIIAPILYWILLGIFQWKILKPHISNAYIWSLVTIFAGIVNSLIMVLGLIITWILFYTYISNNYVEAINFKIVIMPLSMAALSVFTTGFILGWSQKLVLQSAIRSSKNKFLPIVNGFSWLVTIPIVLILFPSLLQKNELFYIHICSIIIFSACLSNLAKALLINQILKKKP